MANKQKTNEEQMAIRQSAPKPTAEDELNRIATMPAANPTGAVDGFMALSQPIGKEALHKATQTLMKYKEGKANLERRIIDNEQWYKLRHWESMRKATNQVEPTSAWLFNSIENKHADAMDNFPSPNILPREEGDKGEADKLTSIVPVVLQQNDFEKTYSDITLDKLKGGTGIYGVFWDSSKLNGLGDINIVPMDILSLFWESGIQDIQKSKNMFSVQLTDNDELISTYPQLQGKLGTSTIEVSKYVYDDSVDTTNKSCVIDWYYKKRNSEGKQVLHYCKYVNDEVLFATENTPELSERGFYDHGKYPFVFDPLFVVKGTPSGFGYVDVGKSSQEYIDRGNQCIMQNMLANTRPRHFIRSDGSVNEQEYADLTNDFVHVDGQLGQDSILPIIAKPLNGVYVNVINNKIDELKETTGNRDVATGGTTGGVTAASGIAAMQESASKLSRLANKSSYRAFREVCLIVVELIRQFYDLPRCFRIMGENGIARFIQYNNAGIKPQGQGMDFGLDMGSRTPLFDIEITAEKQSPYSKMAQNELALQLYGAGFFNPQMAESALMCLDMMDFDRKDMVMQKIAQTGQMLQQMMMLAQMADSKYGGNEIAAGVAAQYGMPAPNGTPDKPQLGADAKESSVTANARQRVAEGTAPR